MDFSRIAVAAFGSGGSPFAALQHPPPPLPLPLPLPPPSSSSPSPPPSPSSPSPSPSSSSLSSSFSSSPSSLSQQVAKKKQRRATTKRPRLPSSLQQQQQQEQQQQLPPSKKRRHHTHTNNNNNSDDDHDEDHQHLHHDDRDEEEDNSVEDNDNDNDDQIEHTNHDNDEEDQDERRATDSDLLDVDVDVDATVAGLALSAEDEQLVSACTFAYAREIARRQTETLLRTAETYLMGGRKRAIARRRLYRQMTTETDDWELFGPANCFRMARAIRARYRDLLRAAQEKNRKVIAAQAAAILDDDVAARSLTLSLRPVQPPYQRRLTDQEIQERLRRTWVQIVRREIPKAHKLMTVSASNRLINLRKVAILCQREVRNSAIKISQTKTRTANARNKKLVKEMAQFWRRYEKEERELRKKAEKEEMDRRKLEEELREVRRQQRKLNFLITQTELYSHFMSKKIEPTAQLEGEEATAATTTTAATAVAATTTATAIESAGGRGVVQDAAASLASFDKIDFDAESDESIHNQAERQALAAVALQSQHTKEFDVAAHQRRFEAKKLDQDEFDKMGFDLSAPSTLTGAAEVVQPTMLKCDLKAYQLKGLSWLSNLYEQGINGILADEMGLGKTVQSIALLCHLAERQNIWGPFLVVSPASTLFNWQQEFAKFAPGFKCLPYWGNLKDRKTLRQFWNQKQLYGEDAPFHVLITSYQLAIKDEKYFNRIKWQYMIADEAQALKSSSSLRWNLLLKLNSRNRLLLTGTPIQNTMQELWALLHFIMPTLFDSHAEFSEWFSKDIESHAAGQGEGLDRHQLSRLHMILKPFMLRRVKKDVENELGDKVEVDVPCFLTPRQKRMYVGVRDKIPVTELLKHTGSGNAEIRSGAADHLMNLIMQFRKVCNHPELFKRKQAEVPYRLARVSDYHYATTYHVAMKEKDVVPVFVHEESPIEFVIPKLFCVDDVFAVRGGCTTADRDYLLNVAFGLFQPSHIHNSLYKATGGCFGFVPFINQSVQEISDWYRFDSFRRFLYSFVYYQNQLATLPYRGPLRERENDLTDSVVGKRNFLLVSEQAAPMSPLNLRCSPRLSEFGDIWKGYLSNLHEVQARNQLYYPLVLGVLPCFYSWDYPFLTRLHCALHDPWVKFMLMMNHDHESVDVRTTTAVYRRASADSSMTLMDERLTRQVAPLLPANGWVSLPASVHIHLPDPKNLVTDSGKMIVLDRLMRRLKEEDHRVLIYCQMTKMIDILEDYMTYRNFKYLRLDGTSKLSDRRDMVSDFQTRGDIFAFLLSVRAGGLGINLTAADTVIFYECDWNPTVDQQAMDRVHRLGQTKQVTVYRLVTMGTVEERILQRAKQKREIQEVVISGGEFRMESFRNTREIVSLLLDDAELEARLRKARDEGTDAAKEIVGATRLRKKGSGRPPKRAGEGRARKEASAVAKDVLASPRDSPSSSSSSSSSRSSLAGNQDRDRDDRDASAPVLMEIDED